MRITAALLGALLVGSACDAGGGDGGGTGDRRGVSREGEGVHAPSRPTPPSGAPVRGALVVVVGAEEIRIGQNELTGCPEDGCPLANLVKLPATRRWCVDEPGVPTRELPGATLKDLRVLARTKGGVKLVPPGSQAPLARSPARLYPCPR